MEGNAPVPGWNAHRHPQQPLRPPSYIFRDVPKCARDLKGSVVHEITDRDHFKESMAEMVLLCTEAMRRTSSTRSASKPLSLEYIADRLDVDDPCFGYMVRSKAGMLQGFITVTTFTNWQKSFRWDSLHELAFYYDESDSEGEDDDEEKETRHCPKKQRLVDRDGRLARELQQTVRLGDPYNEGIVWPRIAEISLLGALGCGRQLVKLAIEQLEFRKRSGEANYDYIALQATDNSITFYESLGFVRVGAVTVQENNNNEQPSSTSSSSTETEGSASPVSSEEGEGVDAVPIESSSAEEMNAIAMPSDIVSSPHTVYEVQRAGESVVEVAKKLGVDAWDIIFLNKDIYSDLIPKCRLKKGTILHVPCAPKSAEDDPTMSPTKWFVAKENDTPRKIVKKFGLPCSKLVAANRNRLPELQPSSRLKAGTRIKVSNLDKHDDVCDPYCHWSYPDDTNVDQGEPSYMMVYKVQRKMARAPRVVRKSLAVPITPYKPPALLLPRPENKKVPEIELSDAPRPPPEPLLAVDIFKDQQRDALRHLAEKTPETEKILDEKWERLPMEKKLRYNDVAVQTKKHYDSEYADYEARYAKWQRETARRKAVHAAAEKATSLFSKVVTLRDDALEGKNYKYWFVLTYIPDLKWCHLAPMVQDGVFGPERKRSHGRPRWRLVDEELCHELDISSMYCNPVKAKALKKTVDADKEEWDILDGTAESTTTTDWTVCDALEGVDTTTGSAAPRRRVSKQPKRARSAVKPLSGKVPILQSIDEDNVQTHKSNNSLTEVRSSPLRTMRGDTIISPSSSGSSSQGSSSSHAVWTPSRKRRRKPVHAVVSTSPRRQLRSPLKRSSNGNNDLDPSRKARKVNSSGARRSVLQL